MRGRALIVIAVVVLVVVILAVWGPLAAIRQAGMKRLAPDAPEVFELTEWAREVRLAEGQQAASLVRTRFHQSVRGARRDLWTSQILEAIGRTDGDAPLSVHAMGDNTLKAVWRCHSTGTYPGELALLFRREGDGGLCLLGPLD